MKDKGILFKIIFDLSTNYPVKLLCEFAGVSRAGYYIWFTRKNIVTPKQQDDEFIKGLILECYNEVNGIYGYYRFKTWLLRRYNLKVNHKRVYRLMKELGIKAKIRRKKEITRKVQRILWSQMS